MSLPVAHGFLGAAIVAIATPGVSVKRDWRVLSIGGALAILPDFDYFFYIVLGLGQDWHRTFTHSIAFALIGGTLAAFLFRSVRRGMALTYALATLSHSLLDAFTSKAAGGVELLWPFYMERMRFGFVDYPDLIGQPRGPIVDILLQFLITSAIELAIFGPIFLATLWLSRTTSRAG